MIIVTLVSVLLIFIVLIYINIRKIVNCSCKQENFDTYKYPWDNVNTCHNHTDLYPHLGLHMRPYNGHKKSVNCKTGSKVNTLFNKHGTNVMCALPEGKWKHLSKIILY